MVFAQGVGGVREGQSVEASMARTDLTPYRLGDLMERRWAGDPFMSLYRDMSRLMEDAFRGLPLAGSSGALAATPRMDISESDDGIRIETDLPGVADKDVEVRLDDDVLTIHGERKAEKRDEKDNYHVMERSMGAFQRSMRLPFAVDPEQVKARFDNGVLTIDLPKSPQHARSQRIEVQASGQALGPKAAGEPRSFAHQDEAPGDGARISGETRKRGEEAARAATPE
jgi:HSP20 family protein